MVKSCILCGFFLNQQTLGLTLHSFPMDLEKRKKWCAVLGLISEELPKYVYICSRHFSPSKLIVRGSKTCLTPNAIPFLHSSEIAHNPERLEIKNENMVSEELNTLNEKKMSSARRYYGDIISSDWEVPEKRKICWKIVKKTVYSLEKKIHNLQQTKLRLEKKISSLVRLRKRLKQKNLISENPQNTINAISFDHHQ